MKIIDFLDEIENNCSNISYLCVEHIFKKLYNLDDDISKDELIEKIKDYQLFMRYLNDFAGVIYNQYQTSVENIYIELCDYLKINSDNEYTFKHIYKKLKNQDSDFLISINDDDIKEQTIKNFEKKLNMLKNSNYYKNNLDILKDDIDILETHLKIAKATL